MAGNVLNMVLCDVAQNAISVIALAQSDDVWCHSVSFVYCLSVCNVCTLYCDKS